MSLHGSGPCSVCGGTTDEASAHAPRIARTVQGQHPTVLMKDADAAGELSRAVPAQTPASQHQSLATAGCGGVHAAHGRWRSAVGPVPAWAEVAARVVSYPTPAWHQYQV